MRAGLANHPGGFNKVHRIIVVLFNPGCHGKNIRVENNVFRRKTDFFNQHLITALTNFNFTLFGVGLAFFIKRHDHSCRAVTFNQFGLVNKVLFTFLKADGVNNRLTLHALKAGLNDFPF